MPLVTSLYRYPIKGLSAESLHSVALRAGETIPFDRAYAIENGPSRFDPAKPKTLPKINFLMLMRHERLAALQTVFDEREQLLTIHRDGRQVARGALATRLGRQMIEQFFAAYMKDELKGPPRVLAAPEHSFSDVAAKCLHLVNLATVRDLERVMGRPLDPLRFRANVYFDGLEAWQEFKWVDQAITLGSAVLQVFARTDRCDATNVNPQTARRDASIPPTMMRALGHHDLGVYAKVTEQGEAKPGDYIGPQEARIE